MIPAALNHLWQSTLVALIAGVLTLVLRRNHAQMRYWLWFAASLKFLIPFAILVQAGSYFGRQTEAVYAQPALSSAIEQVSQPFAVQPALLAATLPAQPSPSLVPAILFTIWAIGFLILVSYRFRLWRGIRTALRMASPLDLDLGLEVMTSPVFPEPAVFGVRRPVLLLPTGIMENLTASQLQAILNHELCHVRRRDNLATAIHMAVETVFWFHPLVWWLGARLMEERELACDEEVLRMGSEPQVYAEGILKICELYLESPLPCVAGVTGANLKKRIEAIMLNRIALNLTLGKKMALAAVGIVVLAAPIVMGITSITALRAQSSPSPVTEAPKPTVQLAQAQVSPPPAPRPASQQKSTPAPSSPRLAFEEASIRPHPIAGAGGGKNGGAMPNGFPAACYGQPQIDPARFAISNTTVFQLIALAYGKGCERWEQMEGSDSLPGAPSWLRSDRFDIQAVVPKGTPSYTPPQLAGGRAPELQKMIQTLLADRFKLALGSRMKEMPVYVLTVAKGGPKLTPSTDGNARGGVRMLRAGDDGQPRPFGGYGGPGGSAAQLAGVLATLLHRPVLDQTGITYEFSYDVSFARPEEDCAACPTVSGALQDQLGLKLDSSRAPVEVLTVDHVEQPSEN